MKTKDRRRSTLFVRGIPAALKQMFKAECVRRGETMESVIAELMSRYVKRPELYPVNKRGSVFTPKPEEDDE